MHEAAATATRQPEVREATGRGGQPKHNHSSEGPFAHNRCSRARAERQLHGERLARRSEAAHTVARMPMQGTRRRSR
eukprot:14497842-Alexandrium_andersonii.AAC.1